MIEEQSQLQGIGAGDVIAKMTKALGIPECSGCKKRRLLANRLRIVGWKVQWIGGEMVEGDPGPKDITAEAKAMEEDGTLLEDKRKEEGR